MFFGLIFAITIILAASVCLITTWNMSTVYGPNRVSRVIKATVCFRHQWLVTRNRDFEVFFVNGTLLNLDDRERRFLTIFKTLNSVCPRPVSSQRFSKRESVRRASVGRTLVSRGHGPEHCRGLPARLDHANRTRLVRCRYPCLYSESNASSFVQGPRLKWQGPAVL